MVWAAVGAAIALLVGGLLWLRRTADLVAWLRKVRPMPIAYVQDGTRVKLVGTLRCATTPLRAPVSGRDCSAYSVEGTLRSHRTPNSYQAAERTVIDAHRVLEFYLDDGSGRALVRAKKGRTMLRLSRRGYLQDWATKKAIVELKRRLETDHEIAFEWPGVGGIARFEESALEEGSRVAVVGTCHWEEVTEGGVATRLVVVEAGDGPGTEIVICDDLQVVQVNPNNPAPGFRLATPFDGPD